MTRQKETLSSAFATFGALITSFDTSAYTMLKKIKKSFINKTKNTGMSPIAKSEKVLPGKSANGTTAMIQLQDIGKVYRTDTVETLAINNISLQIDRGEFLSIMGPSGCGKSTLLNIIGLLDAPTKGQVSIDQHDTTRLSDKKLAAFRNRKLGFIFQSYHLINDLKVLDNVELPLLYRNSTAKQRKQMASEALEKVGLSN